MIFVRYRTRKVDVRLPGKGNSNSHGSRPVHLIITMIQWTPTSGLSMKNSLSTSDSVRFGVNRLMRPGSISPGHWRVCTTRPFAIHVVDRTLSTRVRQSYRGTSLIRNSAPLGPYSRNRGGSFL